MRAGLPVARLCGVENRNRLWSTPTESPDITLIALFLMTAGYAAATSLTVAVRQRHQRPALVAGAAFAGVTAYLFGVLFLANVVAMGAALGGILTLSAVAFGIALSQM